jgi:hypothetical protein
MISSVFSWLYVLMVISSMTAAVCKCIEWFSVLLQPRSQEATNAKRKLDDRQLDLHYEMIHYKIISLQAVDVL